MRDSNHCYIEWLISVIILFCSMNVTNASMMQPMYAMAMQQGPPQGMTYIGQPQNQPLIQSPGIPMQSGTIQSGLPGNSYFVNGIQQQIGPGLIAYQQTPAGNVYPQSGGQFIQPQIIGVNQSPAQPTYVYQNALMPGMQSVMNAPQFQQSAMQGMQAQYIPMNSQVPVSYSIQLPYATATSNGMPRNDIQPCSNKDTDSHQSTNHTLDFHRHSNLDSDSHIDRHSKYNSSTEPHSSSAIPPKSDPHHHSHPDSSTCSDSYPSISPNSNHSRYHAHSNESLNSPQDLEVGTCNNEAAGNMADEHNESRAKEIKETRPISSMID